MRIAVVVMNNVTGDSRVQKIASSARDRGHEVLVVGASDRRASGATVLSGTPVVRVVSASRYYSREALRDLADRRRAIREERAQALLRHASARARSSIRWRLLAALLRRTLPLSGRLVELRRDRRATTDRALARTGARVPALWRVGAGQLVDYEDALLPVLATFRPDVVHVNDPHPLAAAVQLRDQLRQTTPVTVVYDAHEWWEGVSDGGSAFQVGLLALERTHVHDADHVVTVTDEIATRLMDRYRLRERPTVVRNVPRAGARPAPGRETLRTELALAPDVPLLVYSGTLLRRRGVHDIIGALPSLPEVHLALVCPPGHPSRDELTALAARTGVRDRVHLRDFVPADSVAWYLADATLGVSALHRSPHHDLAAPTKLAEYVHARIPLVVSDCTTQAELVGRAGIGEVFRAGDPEALAEAVRRALSRLPELRDAVARHHAADPMDWESEFERLAPRYGSPSAPRTRAGVALIHPSEDLLALPWPGPPLVVQRRRSAPDLAVALTRALSLADKRLVVADGSPTCFAGIGPSPAQALPLLRAWGADVVLVARTASDADGVPRDLPVLVTDPRLLERVPGSTWLPVPPGAEAAAAATAAPDDGRTGPVVTVAEDLSPVVVAALSDALTARGIAPRPVSTWDGPADVHVDSWAGGVGEQRVVDFLAAGAVVVVPEQGVPATLPDRPLVTAAADALVATVLEVLDDDGRRADLRDRGPAYVRAHHAPAVVLERLQAAATGWS